MNEFKDYCGKLFGQYNNNIGKITKESTDRIFHLMKNPNNEIHFSKNIQIGKFYIIRYNYNGNKIWCPIFVIDDRYKPDTQKRIIYAINIDYLPYAYRIIFFNILFNFFSKTIEFNKSDSIDIEKSLKVNFEMIQKLLKNNGNYNYAITAFNYLKIDESKKFFVSTNFAPRLMFINTKIINLDNMMHMSMMMDDYEIKNKLDILIKLFEDVKIDLDTSDQKEYYKRLKSIESKYKLFDGN